MSIAQDLRSNNPASCALCDADSVKYIRCGRGDCAWVDALREEAADRIEALEAENGALKTALRVNMLRHVPNVTHAIIDAIIEKASTI